MTTLSNENQNFGFNIENSNNEINHEKIKGLLDTFNSIEIRVKNLERINDLLTTKNQEIETKLDLYIHKDIFNDEVTKIKNDYEEKINLLTEKLNSNNKEIENKIELFINKDKLMEEADNDLNKVKNDLKEKINENLLENTKKKLNMENKGTEPSKLELILDKDKLNEELNRIKDDYEGKINLLTENVNTKNKEMENKLELFLYKDKLNNELAIIRTDYEGKIHELNEKLKANNSSAIFKDELDKFKNDYIEKIKENNDLYNTNLKTFEDSMLNSFSVLKTNFDSEISSFEEIKKNQKELFLTISELKGNKQMIGNIGDNSQFEKINNKIISLNTLIERLSSDIKKFKEKILNEITSNKKEIEVNFKSIWDSITLIYEKND